MTQHDLLYFNDLISLCVTLLEFSDHVFSKRLVSGSQGQLTIFMAIIIIKTFSRNIFINQLDLRLVSQTINYLQNIQDFLQFAEHIKDVQNTNSIQTNIIRYFDIRIKAIKKRLRNINGLTVRGVTQGLTFDFKNAITRPFDIILTNLFLNGTSKKIPILIAILIYLTQSIAQPNFNYYRTSYL